MTDLMVDVPDWCECGRAFGHDLDPDDPCPLDSADGPTREGRWGIRQFHRGQPTGGGTVGCGWDTEQAAQAANPAYGDFTYEPFPRWGEGAR